MWQDEEERVIKNKVSVSTLASTLGKWADASAIQRESMQGVIIGLA